ncbi:MAG: CdaR family protein [Eubacteriales bacterium]|nr:CdaR family protein [Clostridiales bacterium]MDD7302815.1 CdaR family protein [Eubacteriales bacterium]MDY4434568.1 CdaR family protein [Candidatus Flemingibacterium sp.]
MSDNEKNLPTADASKGDYQVKESRNEKLIAKILCVLAAIILWFYVVMTDTTTDEKAFSGISVDIRGRDRIEDTLGLTIISGYDLTVDVTVKGPRADINRLTVDDVKAYIDMKTVDGAGEYTLPIRTSLPNGITAGALSANYMTVYVDKRTTISVPVKIVTSQVIEADFTMGTPEPSIETVNVSGPEEVLQTIDHAEASFDLGRVSKTLISTGKLTLVDANGNEINDPYVRLQTAEVTVRFPVYVYRDFELKVDTKYGYYDSTNSRITISPASIQVRGDPDVISSMDSISLGQIDEKKITGDETKNMAIMLPDGVENLSGTTTATVTITQIGTTTKKLNVTDINVVNPNGLEYTLERNSMTVTFRGTKTMLDMLSSRNVSLTLDLGYLNKTAGTVSVPVTVNVQSTLSGKVYEIGDYSMNVTIK